MSEDREILVTGGTGQVGMELLRANLPDGFSIVAPDRADLDLTDPEPIARMVASRPWTAVINAGAYTSVDGAESDVIAAWRLNALAPAALAAATAAADIPLVHVSTDYVFDGNGRDAWEVGDAVAPLGIYGASKEGGEQAVRTAAPRHAIVRTSWVFSPHRKNFVKTMLKVGAQRPLLTVVDDQFGRPTSAADLADVLIRMAIRMAREPNAPVGTFHFANAGRTSWFEFAKAVFEDAAKFGGPMPQLDAVDTASYPTAARRPANSVLSTRRIEQEYDIVPRPWREALREVIAELDMMTAEPDVRP